MPSLRSDETAGRRFLGARFSEVGLPPWFRLAVALAELAAFTLLLIPRLASFGAGLFAVVMAGAIYTHATHNESSRLPFNFLLLALSLLVLYARRRGLTKKSSAVSG
ncbi:MAG TPA: DoxX family protein [Pyrinomonadaceae bacterium]|nr:DoxX family protein [Pyrinomonadaceae bacterium]